ncbi:MAG: hypothetical protein ACYTFV_10895 [Planctomycetota bacterium]|jgi:hypothetical protein
MLATHLAGVDFLNQGGALGDEPRAGYLLSDQEYYDTFIRPEEEQLRARQMRQARGVGRGARIQQRGFLQSQGLGGGSFADTAQRGLDPVLRQAERRALAAAQQRGEEFRRQKFLERDQERARRQQLFQTVNSLEGTIGSAIVSAVPGGAAFAPLIQGAHVGAGVGFGAAGAEIPRTRARRRGTLDRELEVVDYGGGAGGPQADMLDVYRGGGGADVYRSFV